MSSFYGDITSNIPCVICDASLSIVFANRSAYDFPVTLKWIQRGSADLNERQREAMAASFENEPYAIAVIHCRRRAGSYSLLADRLYACGTFFYVFGISGGDALVSEFDGRRMMTACLTPRCEDKYAVAVNSGELIYHWYQRMPKPLVNESPELLRSIPAEETVAIKSEPLTCCLTALYSAFCDTGGKFTVNAAPVKGGLVISFSAKASSLPLSATDDLGALLSYFPRKRAQLLFASHIASAAGFTLTTHCDPDAVNALLAVPTYDVGELGFKATEPVHGNTELCIASSVHIWF